MSPDEFMDGYFGSPEVSPAKTSNLKVTLDRPYDDVTPAPTSINKNERLPYDVFVCHPVIGCDRLAKTLTFALEYINAVNLHSRRGAVLSEDLIFAKYSTLRARNDERRLGLYQCKLLIVLVTEDLFDESLSNLALKELRTVDERLKNRPDGEIQRDGTQLTAAVRILPIFLGTFSKIVCQNSLQSDVMAQFLSRVSTGIEFPNFVDHNEAGLWNFLSEGAIPRILREMNWSEQHIPIPGKLKLLQSKCPLEYPYQTPMDRTQVGCVVLCCVVFFWCCFVVLLCIWCCVNFN